MNATTHAVKAHIIDRLRHDAPRPSDRIAQLEDENARLRSLVVAGVGLLMAGAPRELSAAHAKDVREAMFREVPR